MDPDRAAQKVEAVGVRIRRSHDMPRRATSTAGCAAQASDFKPDTLVISDVEVSVERWVQRKYC